MENNQKFKRNKNVFMSLSQTTWKVAHTSYCKHSGPNTSKAPSHLCCKTKRETVAFIVNAHTHRHTYRNYMRIKEIYIQQYALYTTQRSFYSTVWESLRSVAKTQTPRRVARDTQTVLCEYNLIRLSFWFVLTCSLVNY